MSPSTPRLGSPGLHATHRFINQLLQKTVLNDYVKASNMQEPTDDRSVRLVKQVPPGSVLEQAVVSMVNRAEIFGDWMCTFTKDNKRLEAFASSHVAHFYVHSIGVTDLKG